MTLFEQIKNTLDLRTTLEQLGLKFEKQGSVYKTCCPFHKEKTPSFSIKDGGDSYKCYGCEISGDVFTFLENFEKLTPGEALKRAADLAGIKIPEKSNPVQKKRSAVERIRESAAEFFFLNLNKEANQYLIEKRKHLPDTIKKMKVGYSLPGLLEHLKNKGFKEKDILLSGLASQNKDGSIYPYFGGKFIIFPHFWNGDVVHFTMKDPAKKKDFQLRAKNRSQDWICYNQDALKHKEVILVEGENDLLSLIDAGFHNVISLIGGPSVEQLKSLSAHLTKKHLYLWVDKDKAGEGYIRRICSYMEGLKVQVSIITHPGDCKDPDEFIHSHDPDPRGQVQELIKKSVSYLYWEIEQAAKITNFDEMVKHLEDMEVFEKVSYLTGVKKDAVFQKLLQLGFTEDNLQAETKKVDDLKNKFDLIREKGGIKNEAALSLAMTIFTYFKNTGKFFFNSENKASLLYKGDIYQISDNPFFSPLMMRKTGLLYKLQPGPAIWEALRNYAIIHGVKIEQLSWMHTDFKQDAIFLNPNMDDNKIIKISPNKIEEIENGINDDHILLSGCSMMDDNFQFLPDVSIKEGMELLKDLFFKNLACEVKQRYWILSWMFLSFLIDFSQQRPIAKFCGTSGHGKTTAAKLMSLILYGKNHVSSPTPAAAYSNGTRNPFIILDNLENEQLPKFRDFLLQAVGEGSKVKRALGSDNQTIQEKIKCIVAVTAIEPFDRPELVNRTWEFDFIKQFHSKEFMETAVIRNIEKNRNTILSAMFKFISEEILTNLDMQEELYKLIKLTYKAHPKDRTDDSLCMLMLIMEKLTKYFPLKEFETIEKKDQVLEIRNAWIGYQKEKAMETETGISHILVLLNSLIKEIEDLVRNNTEGETSWEHDSFGKGFRAFYHPTLKIEVGVSKLIRKIKDENENDYRTFKFIITSATLHDVFSLLSKNLGRPYLYKNCRTLIVRMKNDAKILQKNGWNVPLNDNGKIDYYHTVHGSRKILLTKKVYS